MKQCEQCGIEFDPSRDTAKFCSPKCRVTASRKAGVVTPNVTLSDPDVTLSFKFTIKRNNTDDTSNPIREAKYWYDIPLAAVPVVQKGWPEMPEFMNGRQYFLWWKNNFATNKDKSKGEVGMPTILNPFPVHDNIRYEKAGEGSRRWGAW